MRIRYLAITAVLTTAIFGFGTGVNAQVDTQALIAQLQAQIAQLMVQIQVLQAQQATPTVWCHTFNTNLRIEDSGEEVLALHKALYEEGLLKTDSSSFDEKTASVVVEFQEKYASEVLAPYGLKRGTGYVGKSTRAKLNALYGCGRTDYVPPTRPTTQPSITVLSPNGGERLNQGQTYEIKWNISPNDYNEDIDIKLYDYSASSTNPNVIQVARFYNNPTLTAYRWTVPSNLTGASYKLRMLGMVSGGVGESVSDFSDNYFSIVASTTQPSITVISPKTGDVYKPGDVINIKWQLTGSPLASDKLNIVIKNFSGAGDASISGISATLNSSSYSYTVPTTFSPGDRYRLAVTGIVNSVGVTGNGDYFTIVAATTQPSIKVLSPNGGEMWKVGETYTLTWTSTGLGNVPVDLYVISSDGTTQNNIATGVSNTGSYMWTIPQNQLEGAHRFYVSSGQISDHSNNVFEIWKATQPGVACSQASDCGADVWSGNITCLNGKLYQNHFVNVCYYPGTTSSRCSSYSGSDLKEICPNGCAGSVCNASLGINSSQNQLSSISDAIARIIQGIQELLKK